MVNGIEVPCLVQRSPKGSMTSEILVDICATFDRLKVSDRSDEAMPYFSLDGHGSWVELPFPEYVNNLEHLWCACLGMLYDTDLSQVEDAPDQNGTLNMGSTKAKAEIMRKKEDLNSPPVTDPYKIIPIINATW